MTKKSPALVMIGLILITVLCVIYYFNNKISDELTIIESTRQPESIEAVNPGSVKAKKKLKLDLNTPLPQQKEIQPNKSGEPQNGSSQPLPPQEKKVIYEKALESDILIN
ncbi:MAG: hypothetical protein KC713_07825 [Candidatus Omnitrophica bacterium]|nr:hypothetical protein [Candidatus Omnitrophota bacterium]